MNQRFSITPARAAVDLELSDSVHRTLAVIGVFGDRNGWCWPSQGTLADLRGVSRKTINLHVKELIDRGYLNIQPRYDQETGAQKSNMMQIKFDFAPDVPPDVTGGVTSKTLQGVSPLGCYTPPNTQDVTHNAPINDTKERVYIPKINGNGNSPNTPATPANEYIPEPIHQLITALADISKTPYWVKTEADYIDAAYCLAGMNVTPADLPGVGMWWSANGFYAGKPALKTILDEWKSYTGGVKRQPVTQKGPMIPAPEHERVGGLY